MEDDVLFTQFAIEFQALAERQQPIFLELSPLDAWSLMCQLQLALRHSENTGATSNTARGIARRLQAIVASDGVLAIVAERGWDAAYDVPREETR